MRSVSVTGAGAEAVSETVAAAASAIRDVPAEEVVAVTDTA